MNRRRFLEHLGVIGGSSLVMTAMSSWELMAGQAGVRPSLTGRPAKADVIVLGAGISGLVVAYELNKLGYDFRILEARDRVGGINWTVRRGTEHTEIDGERQVCTFDEGLSVNVGPWRIPYTHSGILGYCKELGVAMQMFVNEADASYFYYEGAGPFANTRVRLREVKADLIGQTNELLVKAIDKRQLDLPLTAEDTQRFVSYLAAQGYLDASNRTYKAFAARGSGNPYALADLLRSGFGGRMRSIPANDGTTAAPMFHPVGGMDQIPKAFERALGPRRIAFNADVRSVHQSDTGVEVIYVDTKTGKSIRTTADYVVACLPLPVLAGVDINFSPAMMNAVRTTPYSDSAKMGLAMKRRFWEEDDKIFGGHLYSNLPVGDVAYPSWGYWGNKGVMLGFYGNGQMSGLVNKPVKDRIEHVVTHVSKVHPQIRTEFETAYCTFWEKTPYSLGAFAGGGGNGNNERLAALGKPDGRIFLGCAAVSGNGGWQEGAVAAAWKQVKQLHEMAMTRTQTA